VEGREERDFPTLTGRYKKKEMYPAWGIRKGVKVAEGAVGAGKREKRLTSRFIDGVRLKRGRGKIITVKAKLCKQLKGKKPAKNKNNISRNGWGGGRG